MVGIGGEQGGSFGAQAARVGGIFLVAAGYDGAVGEQGSGSHLVAGIGRVGIFGFAFGGFHQLLLLCTEFVLLASGCSSTQYDFFHGCIFCGLLSQISPQR